MAHYSTSCCHRNTYALICYNHGSAVSYCRFGSAGCLSVAELVTIDLVIVYCEIKISELELFLLGLKLLLII